MQTKILEIRDEATYFAVLAVDMNPGTSHGTHADIEDYYARRYHMRRVGYPCDGRPNIAITHLSADGKPFWNDPFAWRDRTYAVAHQYILEHWTVLRDGDVVDVQYIIGETTVKKTSERLD